MKKNKIIQKIIQEIGSGLYRPGEKFESVRALAGRFDVSHVTAYNILNELVSLGLLESKARSGHKITTDPSVLKMYIKKLEGLDIPEVSNLLPHLLQSEVNPNIVPLGTAINMDQLVPINQIFETIPAKTNFFKSGFSHYSYPPGSFDLRFQISKLINAPKINYDSDSIILTTGASESMAISARTIANKGDKVVIFSPCFYGLVNLLKQLELEIIEIPNYDESINLIQLEEVLKNTPQVKALFVQVNFPNPSGISFTEKEKMSLIKLAKKYHVKIVEDDTYSHLSFKGEKTTSLWSLDKTSEVVFYCNSFSKTLGPGIRVGWLIPPKENYKETLKEKFASSFAGSPSNEGIVLNLLKKKGFYLKHTKTVSGLFKKNTDFVYKRFIKAFKDEDERSIKIFKPNGAFSLWIKLPHGVNSYDLYKQLISKNIAITPGSVYSAHGNLNNYIRINCAIQFTQKVTEAIETIIATLQHNIEQTEL